MRFSAILGALSLLPAASGAEPAELFEAKIRPLLVNRCYACHTDKASGGLRVDSRAALLKGGRSGPAVVPGVPAQSLLIQAVSHTHARLRMPPTGTLDPQDVANLDQWVREGAVFPESPREFFVSKVMPVLSAECLSCHGDAPQAGLKLDSRESLLKGGRSGPAVVPGDPERSLLIHAVRQDHATLKMPPSGKLPDEAVAKLIQWVKDGAIWAETTKAGEASDYVLRPDQKAFWSFQPVRKPAPPSADRPEWNRSPVDQFIYAKLKEKSLTPGNKADKATLLRRAAFDLTGPPHPGGARGLH